MKKLHDVMMMLAVAVIAGGCAEVADPAARSNRATITVTVSVNGDNSTGTGYVSDGLLASADGAGDQKADAKQTQNPEISGAGMDPVSAGIAAAGKVAVAGINAYSKSSGKDCTNCSDGSCSDCKSGGCSDCSDDGGCSTCSD